MPEVREYTVYKFEELSDSAKETAREWYRSCIDSNDYQTTTDMCVEAGQTLGIEFDERMVKLMNGKARGEPKIWWSGFSSQGDGACFEGTYRYAVGGVAKLIKQFYPTMDNVSKEGLELLRIAKALQALQSRYFYGITARCTHSGHYYHSGCMSVNVDINDRLDIPDSVIDDTTQLLRDFADWIYSMLDAENDHLNSDEQVDEMIEANQYTFDEDGNRKD